MLSLHLSKCHIVGNHHMSWLIYVNPCLVEPTDVLVKVNKIFELKIGNVFLPISFLEPCK